MNRDEAIIALDSDSPIERTKSARYFSFKGRLGDVELLKNRLGREQVSFVKSAIEMAISRIEAGRSRAHSTANTAEKELPEFSPIEEANRNAIEYVTGVFLHELMPKLGTLRLSAQNCIENYNGSDIQVKIESLASVLQGIQNLRTATDAPQYEEINLQSFIEEILAEPTWGYDFQKMGSPDILLETDPHLLKLAFENGLRNAVEASKKAGSKNPIIITWDVSEIEYRVSILDCGTGISGAIKSAFEPGRTSKQGHSGFGLAICETAMLTLGGKATLVEAVPTGMTFQLRWPKHD